jgi:hypothetical protein
VLFVTRFTYIFEIYDQLCVFRYPYTHENFFSPYVMHDPTRHDLHARDHLIKQNFFISLHTLALMYAIFQNRLTIIFTKKVAYRFLLIREFTLIYVIFLTFFSRNIGMRELGFPFRIFFIVSRNTKQSETKNVSRNFYCFTKKQLMSSEEGKMCRFLLFVPKRKAAAGSLTKVWCHAKNILYRFETIVLKVYMKTNLTIISNMMQYG